VWLAAAALWWLSGRVAPGAMETYCVVKVSDFMKAETYEVMKAAEVRELNAQIQRETKVFMKAEELVAREWKADELNKGTPFPGGRVSTRKAEIKGQFPSEEKARAMRETYQAREAKKADRENERLIDLKKTNPTAAKELEKELSEAREKEVTVARAAAAVEAKIKDLLAKEDEKAGKTSDAQPAPKGPTKAQTGHALDKGL
jgi:hypothetical protein